MSIGPSPPLAASVASTPLARASSSEQDRAAQEVSAQTRQTTSEKKAESAAGIGETDGENNETEDRDADGRRLWEEPPGEGKRNSESDENCPHGKDASGQCGNLLDLCG